jgi:hypothetical protein
MTDEQKTNNGVLEAQFLIGKTLTDVRPLTDRELSLYEWDEIPQGAAAFAFIFEDDYVLIPTDHSGLLPGRFDYHRQLNNEQ